MLPILSENCFFCHGPDPTHRKSGLRLDERGAATDPGRDPQAIVPGDPGRSEIMVRILATDEDDKMPPPDSHRRLSPEQVDIVRRWIQAGASYEPHWAFSPPKRPAAPVVAENDWVKNPIDAFVLARLEAEALAPSPAAPPEMWLRRATFDLNGLPPSPGEIDAFLADVRARGEAAYAAATDRLLASPRFGERMAQDWLDVARYADTHGFNNDTTRSMWRWRDWVIESFNDNRPYDRFIIEQLAGDLLPGATLDQHIATGFGRNHVINSEGGIIDEEYLAEYVADRVRTVGMAFLGLSVECARCHDHKFDPVSQADYYRLFAFFNNVPEYGEDGRIANAAPILPAPTREQQRALAEVDAGIARVSAVQARMAAVGGSTDDWLARLRAGAGKSGGVEPEKPTLRLGVRAGDGQPIDEMSPDRALLASGWVRAKMRPWLGATVDLDGTGGLELARDTVAFPAKKPWTVATWLRWSGRPGPIVSTMHYRQPAAAEDHGRGTEIRVEADGRIEVRFARRWPAYAMQVISAPAIARDVWHHVAVTYDGKGQGHGFRIVVDGRDVARTVPIDGYNAPEVGTTARLGENTAQPPERMGGSLAGFRLYDRALSVAEVAAWARGSLVRHLAQPEAVDEARRREALVRDLVLDATRDEYRRLGATLADLIEKRRRLEREIPTVMVMAERSERRPTHILLRGQYNALGAAVEPGVPEGLLGAWPAGAPRNRLGLARWLTKTDHPLTARVTVNRLWQALFGTGLVKTVEDFGMQGESPSHPELLDWLAREFVDSGWNTKRILRTIVLSATYRQTSSAPAEGYARDPENRLLARGPRVRLPAETIRDNALALAGLLRERVGGPSVFPYQPPDLYKEIVVDAPLPGTSWTVSQGDDRFRRSLYTFWKRTVLHPLMAAFDAPDREFCAARRSRTNTPLQALAMLNEPGLVEAARHLAARILVESGPDDPARLSYGFRVATGRVPRGEELRVLTATLQRFRKSFAGDGKGAHAWLQVGTQPAATRFPEVELAAWAALAGVLLNLDETMTKN